MIRSIVYGVIESFDCIRTVFRTWANLVCHLIFISEKEKKFVFVWKLLIIRRKNIDRIYFWLSY